MSTSSRSTYSTCKAFATSSIIGTISIPSIFSRCLKDIIPCLIFFAKNISTECRSIIFSAMRLAKDIFLGGLLLTKIEIASFVRRFSSSIISISFTIYSLLLVNLHLFFKFLQQSFSCIRIRFFYIRR